MRNHRQSGFIFFSMLMLIVMAGVAMFVLSQISRNIMYETDRAILDAAQANLTSSGLAWARVNTIGDSPTVLDVNDMQIRGAELKVAAGPKASEVQVTISCSRKTYTRRRTAEFALAAAGNASQPPSGQN